MMNKITFLITLIFLHFIIGVAVFAQEKEKIKVNGEIVAYDEFASLISTTFAQNMYTFILKIDKVVKGNDPENYIIIVYKTWDNENKILKMLLKGSNKVKLKLIRERSCDSDFEKLQTEWISKTTTKPDSKMPCYLFNEKDIVYIK